MAGHFALILHAHLPFVRHPEHEHFLEEEWLFEAITESYIPLLRMMQRLVDDHVPFKLTMSITPTLCAMLNDDLLRERYVRHVDLLIDLARRERKRNRTQPKLRELAESYVALFSDSRRFFVDEWKCNLLAAFRALKEIGALEIIASAATHAVLPLHSRESQRAQLLIGRDLFVDLIGAQPNGFWLPECAYVLGLDSILQEANIRWFILDSHGLLFGKPRPQHSIFAPCYTPAGPAAFARDRESSQQVWSAQGGYPGDPAYREFYRDIGFDLSIEQLGPGAWGMRKFSGIKYHRITGDGREKALYDPAAAEKIADLHAGHFLEQRRRQLDQLSRLGFEPIIVAPFDAELFGHWWFEGPIFLERFIRQAANCRDLSLTTPSDYLVAHATQQTMQPAASTWGENGYLEVWLNEQNSWIYPHLHAVERRMTDLARNFAAVVGQPPRLLGNEKAGDAPALQSNVSGDRIFKQLARELLLAQSSDWAFLMKTGTAREYATKRTLDHLDQFNRLHDQLIAKNVDERFLRDCESRDNLFPNLNWRYFA
jgi:1,4-alpha-glucan branching enzyme